MFETKDVYFFNGETKLSGRFYISNNNNDNKSIVIISTGFGTSKDMLAKKAIDICEGGNHVFCYDYRGHGGSEGVAAYEMSSTLAAVDYASNYFSNDLPVILGGQSMGALFSLYAATECKNVIAVFGMSMLLEKAMTPEKWDFVINILKTNQAGKYCIFDEESLVKDFGKDDVGEALKKLSGLPVLLIHFENDDIVPLDLLQKTFLHSPCEKNILILDKGRHIDCYTCNTFNDILVSWINKKKERWYIQRPVLQENQTLVKQ